MKNRLVWLTALLLTGFLGISSSHAQEVENLLANGGFEDGNVAPYGHYGAGSVEVVTSCDGAAVPEDPIEGNYCLHVVIPGGATNSWDSGMTDGSHTFETGKKYTFAAFVKSKEGELQIRLKPERGADPWEAYGEQVFTMTEEWQEVYVTTPVFTENVTPASPTFHYSFSAGDFWIDGVRFYEGDYVSPTPPSAEERGASSEPNPADGTTNVANDVTLSWEPGEFAVTHDVYLGTVFEDVNEANRENPMNVLVNRNQILTTYENPEPLQFSQKYYWRIDEVNASPDTIYKGPVWSFTVEPYAYPITNITATASSFELNQGPENTVNSSGLNANDGHSTIAEDMWLSNIDGPQPTWIQYEFDKPYVLLEMWVWNSNQVNERAFGLGVKGVTIEYSLDGEAWTQLDDVEFAQATGSADYTYNTTIDLKGIYAKFIKLSIDSNWRGLLEQYGLSEVRFFQIPVQASTPQPDSGASGVALDIALDWGAGREAVQHEVYFSSNEQDVIDGTTLLDTVSETKYQVGLLDYGQVYYWKINEINEAATTPFWEGDVWKFSTTEYKVVDDFESYSTDSPIWESWLDGLGFGSPGTTNFNPGNGTGSAVGDDTTDSYTEETIVHSGRQSMPLSYNNNKSGLANYSETEHTLDQTANWTEQGLTQLLLWFRGYPGSVGSFVEAPAGTFTMTASGSDIWAVNGVEADEFHFAYKVLNGAGSIIAKVESVQNTNTWAKAGVMIRETLDPSSAHAMAVVTPAEGVAFQRRPSAAGTSVGDTITGVTAPQWVKIERAMSGTFTASYSANGMAWTPIGLPQNIQMSANVYIGLALTAHDAALTCQAVFSNIQTTGSVSGQWTNQDIGISSNDPEQLYVALADGSGTLGVVSHEDPSATQINTWTQWSVDLSQFSDQGVNLANIQKILLGVGDRSNPIAGGSGKMYFDDIMVGNPLAPPEYENLLVNGGFEDGVTDPWNMYDNTGGGATMEVVADDVVEGSSSLHIVVPTAGANFWDVGLQNSGHVFEAGRHYTLSAFMKCAQGTLDINFKPERAADPWEGYGDQVITITDQWTEYSVTTPVINADVDPASITFHIGFAPAEIWVDNVRFYEGDYTPPE